mmetsp:Transcript_49973/g.142891  ORF Transcript_49973/g.142891 Transcript_49973/m.142891 type:complete len:231 (-) Transcript_49973:1133-1825(-)
MRVQAVRKTTDGGLHGSLTFGLPGDARSAFITSLSASTLKAWSMSGVPPKSFRARTSAPLLMRSCTVASLSVPKVHAWMSAVFPNLLRRSRSQPGFACSQASMLSARPRRHAPIRGSFPWEDSMASGLAPASSRSWQVSGEAYCIARCSAVAPFATPSSSRVFRSAECTAAFPAGSLSSSATAFVSSAHAAHSSSGAPSSSTHAASSASLRQPSRFFSNDTAGLLLSPTG